jgi:hypothetical protein
MYHGKCDFPSNTILYASCITYPICPPKVDINSGWVNKEDIEAKGIIFGADGNDEEAWNHIWRVDVIGSLDFKDNPGYIEALDKMDLTRTDFPNADYGKVLQEIEGKTGELLQGNDKVIPFYQIKAGIYGIAPSLSTEGHDATFQLLLERKEGVVDGIFQEVARIDPNVVIRTPEKACATDE